MMKSWDSILIKCSLSILLLSTAACQNPTAPTTTGNGSWKDYGGGPDQSKYFTQNQITKENVDRLEVAWTYPTGDERAYQINPLIVDSVLYVQAKNNSLVALNAKNGEELWIHANLHGMARRGFTYWENDDRSDRRIIFTLRNTLQAIDAQTGQSVMSFGEEGMVDLRQGLGRDPKLILRIASQTPGKIFDHLLIVGSSTGENYYSSPGHIRAYDVRTGEMAWIFHTIPQPGEYGYETWPAEAYKYAGGTNCWGEMTVDVERGIVFVPLGSPTYDFYGGDRHGANLFGNCLLALDARTGKRLWHFQTVHHDLWDYDLGSAPQLVTVEHEGRKVDAVAIATKQGFLFAFERETGAPLWPIEERSTPPSDMPGEQAWPTQPFPTVLPPFSRQQISERDINNIFLSDEEHRQWKARIAAAGKGLYTPPSTTETIAIPGATGGANFGNTAANPKSGLVFVMSLDYPGFYQLYEKPSDEETAFSPSGSSEKSIERGKVAFQKNCQVCHGEDMAGTNLGPSLLAIADRLTVTHLRQTVLYGVGRMAALPHITEENIQDILALLRSTTTSSERSFDESNKLPEGPVVASGGAPREIEDRSPSAPNVAFAEYLEGVKTPAQRYYTDYGLDYPHILTPPWSSITAYDLNEGVIKWTKPLGEEPGATAKGFENTGALYGAHRSGMIVTSNGILFATVKNGQIYAYDAENGEILWRHQLPTGISGMPAMYELEGRIYLVVNATAPKPVPTYLSTTEKERWEASSDKRGAYVVFSLPLH